VKKVLVTGGAGFVGSSLISKLVQNKNFEVYSLDNYFTGTEENHIPGAYYIHGDCEDISEWVNIKPDIVYHFGEYSRVSTSFEDFKTVWNSNIRGTYKVLEYCRKNKCKFIYSASSTKFADNGENKNQSPYAFFKSQNTSTLFLFLFKIAKQFNIGVKLLSPPRIFNNQLIFSELVIRNI